MNAKYALALILALQVSMSLCDVPAPAQDLVDKYNELKASGYNRLLTIYGKLQAAAAPYVEKVGDNEHGQAIKDYIEDLQTKPGFEAAVKVATGLGQELGPLVDSARTSLLGLYGHYVRPRIGDHVSDGVDQVKAFLDKYVPIE